MRTRFLGTLVALTLSVAGVSSTSASAQPAPPAPTGASALTGPYVKVGYFTQWGIYRRNFLVRHVHASGMAARLTHINYAFANVGADGRCFEANQAGVGDAWADYQKRFKAGESVDGVDLFLKGNLPLIGTSPHGGPGSAFGVFDGFDIDWEWPGSEGNPGNVVRPEDKQNLTELFAEFRRQLDQYGAQTGRTYSLTAFLPADPARIAAGVEVANAFSYLDFATIQGYDLHGAWEPVTNHQGQLYSPPADPAPEGFGVDLAVRTYLAGGAPAAKLVVGIPYYGRGWTGVAKANNGLYQSSSGPARGTYESGVEDYKKVVSKSGTRFYDPTAVAAWLFDGRNFWSYDDPQVIAAKTAYIKVNGLGGTMMWSLDGDTAAGTLTTAIDTGLS